MLIFSRYLLHENNHMIKRRTQMDGKQTSPAAQIPEEILHQIFHLLLEYESEVADPGYTYFSTYSPAVTQFLSIALVCTQWYYAAIPLIYTHCQVRSASSLELLCRTLSTSKELSSRIHSITNSRIDCPAAWNPWILRPSERVKRFEDTIARLCEVLPKTVNLDIEICASSIPRLVSSLETSGIMLTSLRIKRDHNPRQNIGLKHGMHFPYLRSLSLEGFQFDDQIMWPNMPQLRSLRIMGCVMFETRQGLLAGLPSLVRVEFITTYFHLEASVDLLSLVELKPGIQDLVFFDSIFHLSTSTLFPSSAIRYYTSLRNLTVAAYVWPVSGLPLAPFPDLEVLTIMQLHPGETMDRDEWKDPSSILPCIRSLLSQGHLTPSLKVVRIRCFAYVWNTAESDEVEEIVRERSLRLEVRTIKCECVHGLCSCSSDKLSIFQLIGRCPGWITSRFRNSLYY